MFTPAYTRQFERDLKRLRRGGHDLTLLKTLLTNLVAGERLAPKFKDHHLIGAWKGRRECHIRPDWLLIYRLTGGKTSSSLSVLAATPTYPAKFPGPALLRLRTVCPIPSNQKQAPVGQNFKTVDLDLPGNGLQQGPLTLTERIAHSNYA